MKWDQFGQVGHAISTALHLCKNVLDNVSDAIPARKAQTVSYQRAKQHFQNDQEEENEDPSPKSNHIKRKAG